MGDVCVACNVWCMMCDVWCVVAFPPYGSRLCVVYDVCWVVCDVCWVVCGMC